MCLIRILTFSFIFIYYLVYLLQRVEVDPKFFILSQQKRVQRAEVKEVFNFFNHFHILEKLFPWLWRLNEADAKILSPGKFFTALIRIPILGEKRIFFTVTNYEPPKYFAIESKDNFFKYRIEIRLKREENSLLFETSVFCNKSLALFQYTVGNIIFYLTKNHLEQSVKNVIQLYEEINQLEITQL
ncbi:uncharacterized protein LOC122505788 [Leptopilina heterotoma]|uniref:uncharacterized protein LOC122505788 n=1 Tax=Leptopilina heterotoma TaxID=63436 RepID=UPI001CA7C3B9|nr:uncharacterized protein LOC122505788 [Leptopilina heterotoma]XP_043473554.1 uncharacterized protein LOC122505788 [Leptopilina heterotoma]XP_043473556.1 uncharacterized protein LOC122505788 [Leptopilina heterotoma]XP_043473557.1 uncharacterized protein LOC122505788 [Leptopilina heterotoma]XP_043473558.1 uncharacterized protein LOC122505788 [Leptopilina heterotoma]XP_043473559.1 uncharacterized protein LOC122505788 [Leptopilina heterotoma]XP_043473560.1 uncharacterized protein LOC122505788 [